MQPLSPLKRLSVDAPSTVLITASMFASTGDARFKFAAETCRQVALSKTLPLFICDDSPDPQVRVELERHGAGLVDAFRMPGPGKKGQALRYALARALKTFPSAQVVAFFEIEKADFCQHVAACAAPILSGSVGIVTPSRRPDLFQETYAVEQFHSESFGNALLNLSWHKHQSRAPSLDWLFGPICFSRAVAAKYLASKAEMWDAQILPAVEAFGEGANWASVEIGYRHLQRRDEEGDLTMCGKRLLQVNFMCERLGDAFARLNQPRLLVVIAGGAGNLGQKILATLHALGRFRVRVLDKVRPATARIDEDWHICDLAIWDKAWVQALEGAHVVFLLAAQNPFPEASCADAWACMRINANLLEACALSRVGRTVFASSNHVVGAQLWAEGPIPPDLAPDWGTKFSVPGAVMDSSIYASAKVAGEAQLLAMVAAGRLREATIWRIGWCQPGENLASTISVTGTPTVDQGEVNLNDATTTRVLAWFRGMHLRNEDLDRMVREEVDLAGTAGGVKFVNAVSGGAGSRWMV